MTFWLVKISHFNGRYDAPVQEYRIEASNIGTALRKALAAHKLLLRRRQRIQKWTIEAENLGKVNK